MSTGTEPQNQNRARQNSESERVFNLLASDFPEVSGKINQLRSVGAVAGVIKHLDNLGAGELAIIAGNRILDCSMRLGYPREAQLPAMEQWLDQRLSNSGLGCLQTDSNAKDAILTSLSLEGVLDRTIELYEEHSRMPIDTLRRTISEIVSGKLGAGYIEDCYSHTKRPAIFLDSSILDISERAYVLTKRAQYDLLIIDWLIQNTKVPPTA